VDETLTPVYPLTEGLTQQRLRQLCMQTLTLLGPQPARLAADRTGPRLPTGAAGRCDPLPAHPPADADVDELALGHHWAQHRLAFEELLTHQLSQQRLRESMRSLRAPAMPKATKLPAIPGQPRLQPDGRAAAGRQRNRLRPQPARTDAALIQGDVGAGKTVVAALAALQALEAGYQVA
jgi:ATP-dependent DNA helicase RecG